jgi:hypothetical protein
MYLSDTRVRVRVIVEESFVNLILPQVPADREMSFDVETDRSCAR